MLLAGLTTGHKVGLGVVGLVFITFALVSSFVAPRLRSDFPGKNGLSVFVIACVVLFGGMLTAVVTFGRESEAKGAEAKTTASSTTTQAPSGKTTTVPAQESEFKIALTAPKTLAAGAYVFDVHNVGKLAHDFAVQGPNLSGTTKTPLISPGKTATLSVSLSAGTYTIYCTVPGHRAAGMVTKLTVG